MCSVQTLALMSALAARPAATAFALSLVLASPGLRQRDDISALPLVSCRRFCPPHWVWHSSRDTILAGRRIPTPLSRRRYQRAVAGTPAVVVPKPHPQQTRLLLSTPPTGHVELEAQAFFDARTSWSQRNDARI
ncbi:hypothetical protein C8F01DRAFT_161476 [Mycena amicta]|nr:hypothetical protein C8F01DRAFT_161476 [Mycena amicta]